MSFYNDHLLSPSSRARRGERVAERRQGARACHDWQKEVIPEDELNEPVLAFVPADPQEVLAGEDEYQSQSLYRVGGWVKDHDPALEALLDDWSSDDLRFTDVFG